MKIVQDNIPLEELDKKSKKMFGGLVKAVVDIEKSIMAVDAQLHADLEELLLENNSQQKNLWGINLYPDSINTENGIEFDSMINLRPGQNNRSRYVEDPAIREKIALIVNQLVQA